MDTENLDKERLETKRNSIKIILGVLRAAVIINVIFYLVKRWAGQTVSPMVLLPAIICIILGVFFYIFSRKHERELRDQDNR